MGYLIFYLSILVFLIPINFFPLRNWDEAWYGEIIKNMASENYSLLVPFWNGQYYFDKPPLYFWLSLPIVKLFGIGEWQVRFVSVVAASICVLLTYLIGNRFWTSQNDRQKKLVGIFSAIIFVILGQVYIRFSHGNLDALLVALFLATYYFWLSSEKNIKLAWISGIMLGLGFLVKGWTLGLFPLFVIGIHSFLCERKIIPKNLLYIIVGAVLSSGWWYLLGISQFGHTFFNWYIFTPAEGGLGRSFSWESFWFLIRDVGIWWIVVGFVILVRVMHPGSYDSGSIRLTQDVQSRMTKTLLLVTSCFLLPLSFAQEKLDWHNLPAYPFVAIFVGWCIYNLYKRYGKIILVTCCLLLVTQAFVVYKIENIYPDRSKVGAELGYMMTVIKNPGDIVILDDHDFTSFLYYSNVVKVYVVSYEEVKPGEFWRLKYSDLPNFIKNNQHVVLISKNIDNIYPDATNGQIAASGLGYKFVRF